MSIDERALEAARGYLLEEPYWVPSDGNERLRRAIEIYQESRAVPQVPSEDHIATQLASVYNAQYGGSAVSGGFMVPLARFVLGLLRQGAPSPRFAITPDELLAASIPLHTWCVKGWHETWAKAINDVVAKRPAPEFDAGVVDVAVANTILADTIAKLEGEKDDLKAEIERLKAERIDLGHVGATEYKRRAETAEADVAGLIAQAEADASMLHSAKATQSELERVKRDSKLAHAAWLCANARLIYAMRQMSSAAMLACAHKVGPVLDRLNSAIQTLDASIETGTAPDLNTEPYGIGTAPTLPAKGPSFNPENVGLALKDFLERCADGCQVQTAARLALGIVDGSLLAAAAPAGGAL